MKNSVQLYMGPEDGKVIDIEGNLPHEWLIAAPVNLISFDKSTSELQVKRGVYRRRRNSNVYDWQGWQ